MAHFIDDGIGNVVEVYDCFICRDAGKVHPLKEDGKPDYSHVIPCRCNQTGKEKEKAGVLDV